MAGMPAQALDLDPRGVAGDRIYAVYGADGKIGSGKSTRRFRRMDGLLECGVEVDSHGSLWIRTAPGQRLPAPSSAANAALSALVGEPVELRPERATPHHDVAALHIVTTSSLEWLERCLGGAVPSARFRPNLVVRTDNAASYPEEAWLGRRLRIGAAVIELTVPTQRCVMVGMHQPSMPADERILRLLAQERSADFGVYGAVVVPGAIRVSDTVEVLSEPACEALR